MAAGTEQEMLKALGRLGDAEEITPTQLTKTVSDPDVPEVLATEGTFYRWAVIIGKKSARSANSDRVYLGVTSGNNEQPYEISPDRYITLDAPPGTKIDLATWYLDVTTAGDGVVIIYG